MAGTNHRGLDELARICAEAARRYGDDWPRLKASIEHALAKLGPLERSRLDLEIRETLAADPHPPGTRVH